MAKPWGRSSARVGLVGLVLPNVQNLSLATLRRALLRAGHPVDILAFAGWNDIEAVVAAACGNGYGTIGISMQNTEAALASITLARMMRRRGFSGTIVCGGHFATLNAANILREVAEVDAVIRFAGEEALVAMAGGARTPDELAGLPGVVYRDSKGAVCLGAPARSQAPVSLRELHDDSLPRHLGLPAADLVSSRGCEAHCSYCCIAGASALAAREQRRGAGTSGAALERQAADARYTRLDASVLAEEIGWLYHERQARVFNIMDDNLLPLDPGDAARWARRLGDELAARKVGRIAFSLQLRADAVTQESARALAEAGLVRAYVGVDGFSASQLVALGRNAPPEAGIAAPALLAAQQVFPVCNALLIGPTFRLESIAGEIDALERLRGAPIHLLPIDVRAGTAYHARAEKRNLLEGGFLWQRYRFEDPRTALLAQAVQGLPSRLEEHSVPLALYDLGYNVGIARRLIPGARVAGAAAAYFSIAERWNTDQLRFLRRALGVAGAGTARDIEALLAEELPRVRRLDDQLLDEAASALRAVEAEARSAGEPTARAHARGRLLSAVAFSMALAGCGRNPLRIVDGATAQEDGAVGDGDALDVADGGDGDSEGGADASGPALCADGVHLLETNVPNRTSCLPFCLQSDMVGVRFDGQGYLVEVIPAVDGGTTDAIIQCIRDSLNQYCYPSAAGTTQYMTGHCWIA